MYQDCANWETWNVILHFDNDQYLYNEYRRYVRRTPKDRADVESFVRGLLPNGTSDMDSAKELDVVDWDEVAESWWAE